ncbi:MAG: DNRLRE domain-containing protein [Candidatus Auribacterota bacterium]
MKIRFSMISLFAVLVVFAQNAYSVNVTIYSNSSNSSVTTIRSKDATMANPTTMWIANRAGSGTTGTAEYRSLLRFNTLLTEMSGVTHVESAVLRLYCYWSAYTEDIRIGRVINVWTPAGATWSANSAYADYGISQSIPAHSYGGGSTNPLGLYEFDVTAIVNDWLGGTPQPAANNGFIILTDYISGVENANDFYSPLYQTGNAAYNEYRPTLIIQESLAAPVPEPLTILLFGIASGAGILRKRIR